MADDFSNDPQQFPQPHPYGANPVPPAGPAPGGIGAGTIIVITLSCVVALVVIIGFLLALLLPAVQAAREAGRRTACSNNMMQLGLAVHNYHDTLDRLPPLATDDRHWSWTAMLLPFREGSVNSAQITYWKPADDAENLAVVQQFRSPGLLCPTRSASRLRSGGVFAGGQPTDYAAVSTTQGTTWGQTDGMIVFRKQPPTEDRTASSWTTFGACIDGTSNTAMIAEKHMQPVWLSAAGDEPALVALSNAHTIRVGGDTPRRGLAQGMNDGDRWKFGSWHPQITLIVVGDGSVRPVKNTVQPKVLKSFFGRADGKSFDLPW